MNFGYGIILGMILMYIFMNNTNKTNNMEKQIEFTAKK